MPSPSAHISRSFGALHCQAAAAQVVADTKGVLSAAAVALSKFKLRMANGECAIIFATRGRWLVGTEAQVQAQRSAMEVVRTARLHKGR